MGLQAVSIVSVYILVLPVLEVLAIDPVTGLSHLAAHLVLTLAVVLAVLPPSALARSSPIETKPADINGFRGHTLFAILEDFVECIDE